MFRATRARGPFLESPVNVSGPKRNLKNYDPLILKSWSVNMFSLPEKRKLSQSFMTWNVSIFKIQGVLCHPRHARKVPGLSRNRLLGPVARRLVSTNRWLRGIITYTFPWYLTLVSANHTSSDPGLVARLCPTNTDTEITSFIIKYVYNSSQWPLRHLHLNQITSTPLK